MIFMKVLIVIPAYNEGSTIRELLRRLKSLVSPCDILVVDDGSTDGTGELAAYEGVRVLRNLYNIGKGESLKRGFTIALREGYGGVITMDADLQHDVDDLNGILQKASEGFDIVVGSRWYDFSGMPLDRYLSNRLTTLVLSLLAGRRLEDTQSGYRFIRRTVLEKVSVPSSRYDFESEFLLRAALYGFKIGFSPIKTIYAGEKSHIHKLRDTLRFVKLTLKYLWR